MSLGADRSRHVARRVALWKNLVDESAAGLVEGGEGRSAREAVAYSNAILVPLGAFLASLLLFAM